MPIIEKQPLVHALGDKGENLKKLKEIGFGVPEGRQNTSKTGDNSDEARRRLVKNKEINNMATGEGTTAEEASHRSRTDVPRHLHEAKMQAESEVITRAATAAAVAVATHFRKSRLEKAEDSAWLAGGVFGGYVLGNMALIGLKKLLKLQ